MKLINPSVEIWEQGNTLEDMWAHIARCTRVCYQSEKKDDKETEEEFVKRVILKHEPWNSEANHLAMLEHGTVYLKRSCVKTALNPLMKYAHQGKFSKYSKCNIIYNELAVTYLVTTNLRVLVENDSLNDLKYLCAPTEHHVRRVTASFITNIGVTREFNRHRVNSIAEESTRYCNYVKRQIGHYESAIGFTTVVNDVPDGQGEITFVKAAWCPDYDETDWDTYLKALCDAEAAYTSLIKEGWKPQQAREVLPLATKSQLIHTAFVDDWKHFFALRADGVSGPPHPNAVAVAKPLKEEFIKRGLI